jgi:tetratricopeptide (TPR) repeat protein
MPETQSRDERVSEPQDRLRQVPTQQEKTMIDRTSGSTNGLIQSLKRTRQMTPSGITDLKDLFQKGKDALNAREFEEARSLYESVIRDDPDCVEAWNNLGVALCELDLYREALKAYDRIGEDRRTEATWYNVSLAYYYSRDFDRALNCIQKAIDMNSYNSPALDLKGKIHIEQEDYQNAMASFNLAFATNGDPKFLLWEAYSLYLYSEFSKDIDERTQRKLLNTLIGRLERIEKIVSKHQNREIHEQCLYYLGCAYSRYKDYFTAINRLEQCLRQKFKPEIEQAAKNLLEQNWNQIRPPLWKWWFQSPSPLNSRLKKIIAIFTLALLISAAAFFLLHPLFGLKDKVEWSLYLFVAGLLLILLLSPSVEQIKAKDVEIKMHASTPFDPFPSPAKMEGDIGTMSKSRINKSK